MIWWTKSWNPVIGCTKCSPACDNCYAEALHTQRHKAKLAGAPMPLCYAEPFDRVRFLPERLLQPLGWRKPQRIFVGNMGDLFHEDVPFEALDRIFAAMALSPQHTFMLLTKRLKRIAEYLATPGRVRAICSSAVDVARDASPDPHKGYKRWARFGDACGEASLTAWTYKGGCAEMMFLRQGGGEHPSWVNWPLPNVWLGTTIWDQASADRAVPILLDTPAAKRFVSYEPALEPVEISPYLPGSYECALTCGHREGASSRPEVRCEGCGFQGPDTYEVWGDGDTEVCPECGDCWAPEPVCPECGTYMVQEHPDTQYLDWVICGGETGPGARPMHPDWPRSLRDQCTSAGVPFFFKQWGEYGEREVPGTHSVYCHARRNFIENEPIGHEWNPDGKFMIKCGKAAAGRVLDGRTWEEVPAC